MFFVKLSCFLLILSVLIAICYGKADSKKKKPNDELSVLYMKLMDKARSDEGFYGMIYGNCMRSHTKVPLSSEEDAKILRGIQGHEHVLKILVRDAENADSSCTTKFWFIVVSLIVIFCMISFIFWMFCGKCCRFLLPSRKIFDFQSLTR